MQGQKLQQRLQRMQTRQLLAMPANPAIAFLPPGEDGGPGFAMPAQSGDTVEMDPMDETPPPAQEEIPEGPPGSVLVIKYLHEVHDSFKNRWIIKPAPKSSEEDKASKNDGSKYSVYAFTVIRKFNYSQDGKANTFNVTTSFQINSPELVKVGQDVIGNMQGISWTAKPLRIDPNTLLSWYPELTAHAESLAEKLKDGLDESPLRRTYEHLNHLLSYLKETYSTTLDSLASLLEHGEITFDLLWALFVPGKTTVYTLCPVTSEPRALRLVHAELCQKADAQAAVSAAYDPTGLLTHRTSQEQQMQFFWRLVLEYIEVDIGSPADNLGELGTGIGAKVENDAPPTFGYAGLGRVIDVPRFKGAKKISTLVAYPIQYYSGPGGVEGLKERLIQRGKKWAEVAGGMHHVAYRGLAFKFKERAYVKSSVNSRIMIDRKTFADTVPNYPMLPRVTKTLSRQDIDRHARRAATGTSTVDPDARPLTDEELLLTSPIVYGFSFTDKEFLEFIVERVESFEWNDEAFEQLVIPPAHKMVLKTLVESHAAGTSAKFDDFVSGKGHGLVINLFGNPGTGKSLTAEAMSEYVRKPLYVVGAADLGTHADALDQCLTSILKVSAIWGAVVLIDEADVFLEERTLAHIERNAMVAVFLRQLEYFRGILFLTTNRVRVFDEAFQSRIHVSLRYQDLSPDAKRHIWLAFLKKVNGDVPYGGLTKEELRSLGEKKVNGRQIKNVVKTAGALAAGRNETLSFGHLEQVLDLMEQFDTAHIMYQ
ncbi:P-loop containing nucleoside triphosphate hydrolase protein [Cubamyces lactineus]|nr:P-loop containing nucleoside triphosphate hydrolase protein [Cubamyces lactineus]